MPGDQLPSVTCVMTAHNYERYVATALRSVLTQDYPPELLDVVVVDDGSTDDTAEVVRRVAVEARGRVSLVAQANAGLAAATDRAIAEASGELIGILDADDAWLPGKLRRQVELLARRPEVGLVYGDMQIVDADGNLTHPSFFRHMDVTPRRGSALGELLRVNFTTNSTLLFRASLRERFMPIPHESPYADYWIVTRIAAAAELDYLDEPLSQYRRHASNMSFGATGDRLVADLRRELRVRRTVLSSDLLERLPLEDMLPVVADLEQRAWSLVHAAGTPFVELLDVSDDERQEAAGLAAAARRSGSAERMARGLMRAWVIDPRVSDVRRDLIAAIDHVGVGEAERLLDAAENAFAHGDGAAATGLLETALELTESRSDLRVRALSDLGVIAATEGDAAEAAARAEAALRVDGGHVPALELLAHCSQLRGDLVEATHWLRRAAEHAADEDALWHKLAACLLERSDMRGARAALARARDDDAALRARIEEAQRFRAASPAAGGAPRAGSVLIVVDYFHPSVGGSELLAEEAAVSLIGLGWHVEVATRALAERTERSHRGAPIHELTDPAQLAALVAQRSFDALLVFSGPSQWPIPTALALEPPRPRVVAVPCINADGYRGLQHDARWRARYRALAESADVLVYSSIGGFDARLCRELGLGGVYVPNAVPEARSDGGFRAAHGIPADAPLLLAVGNFFPEKNHLDLLDQLRAHDGDWRLALVGRPWPDHPQLADEIARAAALDPRVTIVPGLPPAAVASAMEEATVLLLPSLAEATPLVLLEAMRHRLPWIATPTCGSAHDHAGGLIVSLERFPAAVSFLLANRTACTTLGAAGRRHFDAAYTWDVIGPRYARVLSGADAAGPLDPPAAAVADTEEVRGRFFEGLIATPAWPSEERCDDKPLGAAQGSAAASDTPG